MSFVKAMPPIDLEELKAKGHHSLFYVKSDPHSIEAMYKIAEYRSKAPEEFEKFDRDIWTFSNENMQTPSFVIAKDKAIKMIHEALPKYKNATLHHFGSNRNGCGLQNADVDLCWNIPTAEEIIED